MLQSYDFFMGEHGGTHIDAPSHFCKGCKTIDQIPLSDLLNLQLSVVDVSEKVKNNANYKLTISDLEEWEEDNGRIPEGSVVFVNFGWARYYPARETYIGCIVMDLNNWTCRFPGYGAEAVIWLAESRNVKGIGTDAPGFDVGADMTFPAHTAWLTRHRWAAEVLANLDKVPATGARVSVLPTKFQGGSGAASRIYAVWSTDGAATPRYHAMLLAGCLVAVIIFWAN